MEEKELLHGDHMKEELMEKASKHMDDFLYANCFALLRFATDVVNAEGYEEREAALENLEEFLR